MSYIGLNNFSITGDCNNTSSGEIYFEITGDSPNWLVTEVSSSGLLPTTVLTPLSFTYYVGGLPFGSYQLIVTDSGGSPQYPISFYISTGTTTSAVSEDTTCNLPNGSVTGYTTYNYGTSVFYLYDISNTLIDSASPIPPSTNYVFTNLTPGDYYIIADDGGGCSGQSESVIVRSSTNFTFGYYSVDDASCVPGQGTGKIYITGLTNPTSAFTINWLSDVNGQTGTVVTGLTQGLYTVEITNSVGCTNTESIYIDNIPPIGIANGSAITVAPTCFNSDGSITVIVTGGTAPFYYSCSNGDSAISFSTTHTFSNLTADLYTITVTDAGLCQTSIPVTLATPGSFGVVSISTTNSNCNSSNGVVNVTVNNGVGGFNFTYTLSGNTGLVSVSPNQGQSHTFNGVPSGDYIVLVDDNLSCVFTGTTTIINENKFTISAATTGTTCGLNNGSIIISTSTGGTLPYSYNLVGPLFDPSPSNITQLSGVFNNLKSGNYTLTVTDSTGCQQITGVYIDPSSPVQCALIKTDPVLGNDGTIDLIITAGNPPFTYNWSPNVGSQTGLSITGLSSGIYTVLVTDSDGCQLFKSIKLAGTDLIQNYDYVTICEKPFGASDIVGKRGIQQMYNEGYSDLISGDTNCILNSAEFKAVVEVGDEIVENTFYTSTSLQDFPTDFLWADTLQTVLESFTGISEVVVDLANNTITITNDCEEINKNCGTQTYNLLNDTRIIVNMVITYNISCVACN
jgi:hypothetical protein